MANQGAHYGSCEVCGANNVAYYGHYCPMCIRPEKGEEGWNLFQIMYFLEARGMKGHSNHKVWHNIIAVNNNLRNDISLWMNFDHEAYPDHDDTQEFVKAIAEFVGSKRAFMEVSW
jgi:hypothetical protein